MPAEATSSRADNLTTAAYVRVSTVEQAEEGHSLAAQERSARAYAMARDWGEVTTLYADACVSGSTTDRPALQRLLADARAGLVDRLIVTKLDRIGHRAAGCVRFQYAGSGGCVCWGILML